MDDVKFDLLGIGNAMVDVVAQVDNTFLSRHDMLKGTMILVDAAQRRRGVCRDAAGRGEQWRVGG